MSMKPTISIQAERGRANGGRTPFTTKDQSILGYSCRRSCSRLVAFFAKFRILFDGNRRLKVLFTRQSNGSWMHVIVGDSFSSSRAPSGKSGSHGAHLALGVSALNHSEGPRMPFSWYNLINLITGSQFASG